MSNSDLDITFLIPHKMQLQLKSQWHPCAKDQAKCPLDKGIPRVLAQRQFVDNVTLKSVNGLVTVPN